MKTVEGVLQMKKWVALLFFAIILIGVSVPVSANAKQKTINTEIVCRSGEVLKCSFPYYSKWEIDEETLASSQIMMTTSKGDSVSIEVLSSYDDYEVGIFIQGLSDKKGRKKLTEYIRQNLGDFDGFKFKKDGNGKYLLIVDSGYYYSVLRPLDDDYLLVYTIETYVEKVSKTQRKRILSYAKNSEMTVEKNVKEKDKMSEMLPKGKWYDKNGNTMLEFDGENMYATWWSGMETPEEFKIKIIKEYDDYYIICVDGEYGTSFGIMSRLEIEDDGTLTAYEEILDGESHSYKFVPEDRIEAEKAVKDYSKNLPKTIESEKIESFSLVLRHYNVDKLGSGTYSWEISKNDEGKYVSEFSGMGPSYIIVHDTQEVDESFIKGLMELLKEEKVSENNGLFFSHDENDIEYSLYIRYESGEMISIRVGSKALDKWPINNEKFIEYVRSI